MHFLIIIITIKNVFFEKKLQFMYLNLNILSLAKNIQFDHNCKFPN